MTHRKLTTHSEAEISEETAEWLADEAEAGYDLDEGQVIHVGRGRPSLSGEHISHR